MCPGRITMHFADDVSQFASPVREVAVGDVIWVNGDASRVADVREREDGALAVRLEEPAAEVTASFSTQAEDLLERAADVRARSEQLCADAVERRLQTRDERARDATRSRSSGESGAVR